MFEISTVFESLVSVLLIPLSWLPPIVYAPLRIVISIFGTILLGRIFKWLWDALPLA